AFDRPTWMKWLNKKSTVFLTGQFFWHYLVGNPDCGYRNPSEIADQAQNWSTGNAPKPHGCLVGGLDLPSTSRLRWPHTLRDKIRDWETLFTLAGFTFYRGGSVVPVLGIAVDPVNSWSMEPFWTVDYVIRDDLVVNLGQRYFFVPRGDTLNHPVFETWGIGGLNKGRSETSLRVTYQF